MIVWLAILLLASLALRAQGPPAPQGAPPPAPAQPLPYSHKKHLALGLTCKSCHLNPDAGKLMTFPPTATCMACHQTIAADRTPIQKLAAFAASDAPIPWVRVYRLPDYVFWKHATHLEAEVTCADCHGPVAERDVITQETNVVTMVGCLSCHNKRQVFTDCGDCHAPRQSTAHDTWEEPVVLPSAVSISHSGRLFSASCQGPGGLMRVKTRPVMSGVVACAAAAVIGVGYGVRAQPGAAQNTAASREWPTYGHDPGGMRFSPLNQITPANVSQLQVAWVYHMKPAAAPAPDGRASAAGAAAPAPGRGAGASPGAPVGDVPDAQPPARGGRGRGGSGFSSSEVTPLVVNGTMYIATPYYRVVAVDSTTGKEVWAFQLPSGNPSTRGVEYWPGDAQTPPQIVFGSSDGKMYSLDAKTGKPNEAFGNKGVVLLDTPEILQGLPGSNGLSSPPIVYKNLVITGGKTQENPPTGPAGDVRAWNMHTGKLEWTFRSVPRAGENYNDTWGGESWKARSGVNVWGFLTVDVQRGIVYMPFGAPSVDQYGGDRVGDNLFATSLVAADANTGKYLWHFQVVHHDIWDADLSGAPALVDVKQGGRTIPGVAVINKMGLLFLLDRVTGKPIYGVEERPVPQSEVPLERTSKTQPFPIKPAPLSRMSVSAAEIATVTPELEAACKKLIEGMQLGGPYLPVSYNRLRAQFPGNHGGVNWGGTSFNPQLGYLFVSTSELGQVSGLRDRDPSAAGAARGEGVGNRVLPDGPYQGVPGGGRFKDNDSNMMCQQPPWGQLTAVNVNTGEFAWRVPLGITDSLPPDRQKTGRPGNGGTIATAGGLVFIGATDDSRFRAFDAKTGKELWTFKLAGAAQATPMTYEGRDGKQYVVIAATGGGFFGNPVTDDSIMAFALAEPR